MTLAFSTQIKGKPTYFVDKIWQSLLRDEIEMNSQEFHLKLQEVLPIIGKTKVGSYPQKKHTIRQDAANRWKTGNNIHFVINNRTPQRFQFAPIVKCISTQTIEIEWYDPLGLKKAQPDIYVDRVWILGSDLEQLAINDGFNTLSAFYNYFNKDFKGKIIHWTNLKY